MELVKRALGPPARLVRYLFWGFVLFIVVPIGTLLISIVTFLCGDIDRTPNEFDEYWRRR